MTTYIKARFTSKNNGSTAGLILTSDQVFDLSITEFSRMFPVREAMKMERVEKSPEYPTWEGAFNHEFS